MLAQVWDQVFQGALGPLPAVVHSPCCAEFVVSRARILQRSREFYASLRYGLPCCRAAGLGRIPAEACWLILRRTGATLDHAHDLLRSCESALLNSWQCSWFCSLKLLKLGSLNMSVMAHCRPALTLQCRPDCAAVPEEIYDSLHCSQVPDLHS